MMEISLRTKTIFALRLGKNSRPQSSKTMTRETKRFQKLCVFTLTGILPKCFIDEKSVFLGRFLIFALK